ncbi:MAG: diguanylate cyclase [Faecalibacterium sp.]|nr:diguanylate cyclase [Ruminococcus sp.]MCM1393268.1 diguanylate cyclase [Ruminococcus sp.]MCM1485286.1 diguanylate cyclase [Faecalibacterium sp.]
MENKTETKQTILIADDSEINRSILADMLGNEYEILEAENGIQTIQLIENNLQTLSLVLLDIVMPEMNGFGVLDEMNEKHYIENIPVIMISAESSPELIEKAYELGVTDFISRPFDAMIVHHRVVNTLLLYAKQKRLTHLVAKQIYEKEKQSSLMIEILSQIVEFRNGESGNHIRRVRAFTKLLLEHLSRTSDKYNFSHNQIEMISTASALHDIGKISIDEKILNKPGKLTDEEFEKIKMHPVIADRMLEELAAYDNGSMLVEVAREICRWHHERYDGKGYPDGLKGDEIPISAQIVALADVYDALTDNRVYKKAIAHDEAIRMIVDGECGTFNPDLIKCLVEIEDTLAHQLEEPAKSVSEKDIMQNVVDEFLSHEDLKASTRTFRLLEDERMKHEFFAVLTNEVQFEYIPSPPCLKLTQFGAKKLMLPEYIDNPLHNEKVLSVMSDKSIQRLSDALSKTTAEKNEVVVDCRLNVNGEKRWFRFVARTLWSGDDLLINNGVIGKIIDIHDSVTKLNNLKRTASSDTLTGLLNHAGAKEHILEKISAHPDSKYALAIFDLDRFKEANDKYGHMFGDKVLCHTAQKLRNTLRTDDITARVGGDEFLIFIEYKGDPDPIIQRVFSSLNGQYEDFPVSLSMGIATTENIGFEYDDLFKAADKALYFVKRNKRGDYRFYDDTMNEMFSVISDID